MKRIAVIVLFLIALLFTIQNPVYAQEWKQTSIQEFGEAFYTGDDINLETSWAKGLDISALKMADSITGGACVAATGDLQKCVGGSAAGYVGQVIASTFSQQPADFGLWLADTGHSLGFLPKPVYAQGIGFSGLQLLLPVWKAFRNIAYLLMAVVMITIGFLIMFRKKIDPKTVVTAQNAIPRVIIALILITFSYAIVGILIDVMYLVLFFFIALFRSTTLLQDPSAQSLTGYLAQITGQNKTAEALYGQGSLMAIFGSVEYDPWKILFGVNTGLAPLAGSTILGVLGLIIGFGTGTPAGAIGGILLAMMPLVHLILAIAVLFLFIRLAVFFVSSYIQIIMSLLMAPLQLLTEAFPGSNAFSSWIKNLAANLAVFPIAAAMFMLSAIFMKFANDASAAAGALSRDTTSVWTPPFVGLGPLNNTTSIMSIVSLGILFAIPTVAGSIKEALKAKPAVPMLDFGGAGGSFMNIVSLAYYFKSLAPAGLGKKIFGEGNTKQGEHA